MNKNHIRSYIEQYHQQNMPTLYKPEKDSLGYVYIFGNCFGVVLIPTADGRILFTILGEDDGHYSIREQPIISSNYWLKDWIKCLTVAQDYLKENATQDYLVDSDIPCGFKLPYKL